MSKASIDYCDNCGNGVSNGYAVEGWIRIKGEISLSAGSMRESPTCWKTGYLPGPDLDFCNLKCLEEALKKKLLPMEPPMETKG